MNPRALLLHLVSAVALLASAAHAATVSVTVNTNGASYTTSDGSLLPAGCVVRVGIFDTSSPANIATIQTSNNFLDLNALFTPLAEGLPGAGTISEFGTTGNNIITNYNPAVGGMEVFGQITGIESTYCTAGTQLYTWVFNNADPLLATEWGVFTASTGWNFPAALGSETLATKEITDVLRGISVGAVNLSSSQLQLSPIVSPVPEPSGAMLIAIISFGVVLRRARRQMA